MDISWSKTMILAETLNFSMRKFKVSARIVVSDKLIFIYFFESNNNIKSMWTGPQDRHLLALSNQ
jgi:hypothetical protein